MTYDFDNPAGLDVNECMWLKFFCKEHGIKSVLEFGPGNSTVAMLNGGVKKIETWEQDGARVNQLVDEKTEGVYVRHYAAIQFPIYKVPSSARYEMAFIDGPTGHSVLPSRLNACLFALCRAPLMLIHDSKRDAHTVDIMQQIGCVVQERHDSGRGIVVLRTPTITPQSTLRSGG